MPPPLKTTRSDLRARFNRLVQQGQAALDRLSDPPATSAPAYRSDLPGSIDNLDEAEDPMGSLWHHVSYADRMAERGQLLMGAFRDPTYGLVFGATYPNSNALTMGPPQVNKSSWLASQIAAFLGTTFVITSKPDLVDLLAVVCARKGPVIQLNLTGGPTRPGMIEGRISLLAGGETWAGAKRIGSTLAKAAAPADANNHKFWEQNAGGYIAIAVFATCLAGKSKTGDGYQFLLDCVSGDRTAVEEMADILADLGGDDGQVALKKWASYEGMHAEGIGSIRLTASHALQVMERREVREQSTRPNIDLGELVASTLPAQINLDVAESDFVRSLAAGGILANDGWPGVSRVATIFVTIDDSDEEAAVLGRALIHQLWAAVKEQHAADRLAGITNRPKILVAWDELATGFPDPAYPKMVAQCADRGLIVSAVVHDLGQVEEVWGSAVAQTFLTIHRQVNAFPGISHVGTLTALSTLIGNRWESRKGDSYNTSVGQNASSSFGGTWSDQRIPVLDPGEVRAGKPGDPMAVLAIHPYGWGWVWPTPIWGARPWPRALVASMSYVVDAQVVFDGQIYWLGALPVPELDRADADGLPILTRTQHNGAQLLDEYRHLRQRFAAVRRVHAAPEPFALSAANDEPDLSNASEGERP